jgi:hypothetical protein
MKKIFLFLVAATLLVSCNSETEVKPDMEGPATMLTFSIGLPAGDPVTYAIQTNAELEVKTLDIYQFDKATGVLDATYKFGEGAPNALVQTGATINLTVTSNSTGEKTFLFVANNGGKASFSGSYDAFKSQQVTPLASAAGEASEALISPLMMTAEVTLNLTGTAISGQSVLLRRVMSRIDIKNMEPALYLTKVTLKNVSDRSFVFPQTGAEGDVTPAGTLSVALPQVEIPQDGISTPRVTIENGADFIMYKHLFYPYINNAGATEATAPTLRIQGVLKTAKGDVQVAYDVPMKLDGQTGYIRFARNTRYTLVIANAYTTTLNSTIKVDLWQDETIHSTLTPIAPALNIINGLISTNNTSVRYDAATNTISQDINAANYTELNILRNTDWTATSDATWVTPQPYLSHYGQYYQFLSFKDYMRMSVAKNETGVEREAVITLTSTLDNNLSSTFKVKQAGN